MAYRLRRDSPIAPVQLFNYTLNEHMEALNFTVTSQRTKAHATFSHTHTHEHSHITAIRVYGDCATDPKSQHACVSVLSIEWKQFRSLFQNSYDIMLGVVAPMNAIFLVLTLSFSEFIFKKSSCADHCLGYSWCVATSHMSRFNAVCA